MTATVTTRAPRTSPASAGPHPRSIPWLALVASAYAAAQLALVVPHTGHLLGWDETVYVSQVDPRHPAAYFSAPRSRGISFLVAPVLAATSSVLVLHIVLALLSALALYAAFRVWGRILGTGTTALAALLFAGLWTTQINGSQAMPNLWVAFGAVAAVGWFLRTPTEPHARWWLAAALAFTALMRTPDAGWLSVPLLAIALLVRIWRPAVPAVIGGLALGAAEWTAEAYVRFGGIPQRLHVSSATEGGMRPHLNLVNAWHSLNGPELCRPCEVPLRHPELTLWWLALPLLAAVALVVALRDRRPATAAVPVACAAGVAFPYLFLITYSAPRFLLPAYALLALPLAALATRVVRAGGVPVAITVALAVALQLGSQYVVVHHAATTTATADRRYENAAHDLRDLGLRPPCLVTGRYALPVAYEAGCASAEAHGHNRSTTTAALLARSAHEPTAVLVRHHHKLPHYAHAWTRHPLPGTHWTAYIAPRG